MNRRSDDAREAAADPYTGSRGGPGADRGAGADRSPKRSASDAPFAPPHDDPRPPDSSGAPLPGGHPSGEPEDAPAPRTDPWEGSRVTNVFYGMVNARNGVFGTADATGAAEAPDGAGPSVTGPLREREVRAAVETFAVPERFDDALKLLDDQRVLVLTGGPGTGKRTGAVCLLSRTGTEQITVLSPSQALDALAGRELVPGRGYIVLDWFGVDRGVSPAEHEYLWSVLLRHVQDSEAHLVLTCDRSTPVGATAPALPWPRPRTADVLRGHLRGECERLGTEFDDGRAEAVEAAAERLPDDRPITDLVEVARGMAAGEPPREAVDRVLRSSSRTRVRTWFDADPDRRDIADAAALALLHGIHERDYELLAKRLHERVTRAFPPPPRDGAAPGDGTDRDRLPALRRSRGEGGHDLIRVEHRDDGWMVRRFPAFAEAGDRTEVLRQLWERYDADFWNAVEAWTHTVVHHQTRRVHLAHGLAALAGIAFEEVHDLYLDRWSRGGGSRRDACVFVLWAMCMEGHAPAALRTVDRWLARGTPAQVETALHAWSGELGVKYPTEAVNRLRERLLDPRGTHRYQAALSVGVLFGSLVDRGGSGRALLRGLGDDLADLRPVGSQRTDRVLVLTAVCSALTVATSEPLPQGAAHGADDPGEDDGGRGPERDGGGGRGGDGGSGDGRAGDGARPEGHRDDTRDGAAESRGRGAGRGWDAPPGGDPAIARHVVLVPGQIPLVAGLWAEAVRYRPVRRLAIESLWRALLALQRNGADAQSHARSLLGSLAGALRPDERDGFRSGFATSARHREDPFTDAVLDLLAEVFEDGSATGPDDVPGSDHTEKATPV
ncbi:hypothetical protein [Nocardiopsis alborubida]|uniref:Uncharacterized protein n=1 Tax=Nocardiopsis alborubida TaxID=146802 RepID=A0A7X6RRG9_9ACTN|nr:hypothetical protein [Nocardiopsis alborubida]NKY99623.1 hypothetical protein [Nocardiopsis alborubida]